MEDNLQKDETMPRERRIPIMFSEEELAEIDEWRFANHIATRAGAVRRLCRIALLTEDALEDVVDKSFEGLELQLALVDDALEAERQLRHPQLSDVKYTADEIGQLAGYCTSGLSNASDNYEVVHRMLVTLYNAVAPLASAKTISAGDKASSAEIEREHEAVAKFEEARERRSENRFLVIALESLSAEEKAQLERMSDDEEDRFWGEQIAALKAEEAADPHAFAKNRGLLAFWQTDQWRAMAREKMGLE